MRSLKPAKHKPASLQARAVIIMCELSSECTKFGGNALLCFFTDTWNDKKKKSLNDKNSSKRKGNLNKKAVVWTLTALPSLCKAKTWSDVLICSPWWDSLMCVGVEFTFVLMFVEVLYYCVLWVLTIIVIVQAVAQNNFRGLAVGNETWENQSVLLQQFPIFCLHDKASVPTKDDKALDQDPQRPIIWKGYSRNGRT